MNSLMLGFAGLSISVGVLAGAGALSTQSAAAETKCGGVDTSIISGTVCDGVSSDAANTDSSKNPIIAVITFVLQVLTGAVGVAAVGAIIYYANGFVQPLLAAIVLEAVFLGALIGPRLQGKIRNEALTASFAVVLVILASLMLLRS